MADLWISDAFGRVLGPLSEAALRDLLARGRLKNLTSASKDGKNFEPIAAFPEILALTEVPPPAARQSQEKQAARSVRLELDQLRSRSADEVLDVAKSASLTEYRAGFFAKVKRYSPDKLATDCDPMLRAAHEDMFLFLASVMVQVEARLQPAAPPPPAAAPVAGRVAVARVAVTKGTPAPPPAPPVNPFTYLEREFVGFTPLQGERVQCTVEVTRATAGMFFEHRLMNIANGGIFLRSKLAVELGRAVELVFDFTEAQKKVSAAAKIAFENRLDPKQPLGFGLRFVKVNPDDLAFLKEFAQQVQAATAPAR